MNELQTELVKHENNEDNIYILIIIKIKIICTVFSYIIAKAFRGQA